MGKDSGIERRLQLVGCREECDARETACSPQLLVTAPASPLVAAAMSTPASSTIWAELATGTLPLRRRRHTATEKSKLDYEKCEMQMKEGCSNLPTF